MNGDVDHVKWLRLQASRLEKAAEGEADEKKGKGKREMGRGLRNAANALEFALAGVDPGAMGGHAGLLKRLRPGTQVRVKLMTGQDLVGEIRAMGRYDFALWTGRLEMRSAARGAAPSSPYDFALWTGRLEMVVEKHAVAYFELLATTGDSAGQEEGAPAGEGTLAREMGWG